MDEALFDQLQRVNAARAASAPDQAAEASLQAQFGCHARLAVYGSLAPGERNHHQLAGCPGSWSRGAVPGRIATRRWKEFTLDCKAPPVAMLLLDSAALPQQWAALDAFEGPDYLRILVPVVRGDQPPTVANCYAARRPG